MSEAGIQNITQAMGEAKQNFIASTGITDVPLEIYARAAFQAMKLAETSQEIASIAARGVAKGKKALTDAEVRQVCGSALGQKVA